MCSNGSQWPTESTCFTWADFEDKISSSWQDVYRCIAKRQPDVNLIIAGIGPYMHELKRLWRLPACGLHREA